MRGLSGSGRKIRHEEGAVLRFKITLSRIASVFAMVLVSIAGTTAQTVEKTLTQSWPKNGGNLFNQNYSPLTQINRQNVAKLKGVWRARLEGSGTGAKYSGEAQPIVEDGVVYIVTGADD